MPQTSCQAHMYALLRSPLLLLLVLLTTRGQDRVWTRMVGTNGSDIGRGVSVDTSSGNVYVTGQAEASLHGQPYVASTDIFLIKYASSGTRVWTRMDGTSGSDVGLGVSVDTSSGDVYVTGQVAASLDSQPYEASNDIFLMKYASNGTRVWTRMVGTSGNDIGYGVSVDTSTGDVYVTDIFLMKYASNGTRVWTRMVGTNGNDRGYGVSVDSGTGDIYVTGQAGASLHDQPYVASVDIFLMKYASNGTIVWTRMVGTNSDDRGWGLSVDANAALVYVTGQVGASIHEEAYVLGSDVVSICYTNQACGLGEGPGVSGSSMIAAGVVLDLGSSGLSKTFQANSAFRNGSAASKAVIVLSVFVSVWGVALVVGLYFYRWEINVRKHEKENEGDVEFLFDAFQRTTEKVDGSSSVANSDEKEHGWPRVNNIHTSVNSHTDVPKETELRPAVPSGVWARSEFKSSQVQVLDHLEDSEFHSHDASQEAGRATVLHPLSSLPPIHQCSDHNSVITRMAALEVAIQEQRTRMINSKLVCDLTAVSAKQALLAEFDRGWCLDSSTGLFIAEPMPSVKRSPFRGRLTRSKVSPLRPRLPFARTVTKAVTHSISSNRSMRLPHDDSGELDKTELNAPDYLFVSYQLARLFPDLVESFLVLQYRSTLPGNAGLSWHKLVSRNNQQSVVVEQDALQYDASLGQALDDVEKSMQAAGSSNVGTRQESSPMMPAPSHQGVYDSLNFLYPCFSFLRDGVADTVHQHPEQGIQGSVDDGSMLAAETGFVEMQTTDDDHGGSSPSSASKEGADSLSSQSSVDSRLVRELFSDWESNEEDEEEVGASARSR
eukprot:gene25064-30275_t